MLVSYRVGAPLAFGDSIQQALPIGKVVETAALLVPLIESALKHPSGVDMSNDESPVGLREPLYPVEVVGQLLQGCDLEDVTRDIFARVGSVSTQVQRLYVDVDQMRGCLHDLVYPVFGRIRLGLGGEGGDVGGESGELQQHLCHGSGEDDAQHHYG